MRRILALTLFAALPLAAQQAAAPTPAPAPAAQAVTPAKRIPIPDTFTNLKVLPADITRPQLMAVMRQMSVTFKVRCSFCHTVADDLSEGNFASDDKSPKEESRKLIRIIHAQPIVEAKP